MLISKYKIDTLLEKTYEIDTLSKNIRNWHIKFINHPF